jgi:hypothetical protein
MAAETILTPAQRSDLRIIAGVMIPASPEYGVPGADDAIIQTDIVATLGRDAGMVHQALDQLARLAGMPLADLDAARCERRAGRPWPRSPAWCCKAIIATTVSSARWGWNCDRHSRRAIRWSRATGRCSIP